MDFVVPSLYQTLAGLTGGGAVCWDTVDCFAWGSFSGSAPSPVGTPLAGGLSVNQVLARSVTRGCPSALDAADDTDDSSADFGFVVGFPLRTNTQAPVENPCPQTSFKKTPGKKTPDRSPTFKFRSSEKSSHFQCSLDGGQFTACTSPRTLKKLKRGRHAFSVRAIDAQGATDPTPARAKFKVVKGGGKKHRSGSGSPKPPGYPYHRS